MFQQSKRKNIFSFAEFTLFFCFLFKKKRLDALDVEYKEIQ